MKNMTGAAQVRAWYDLDERGLCKLQYQGYRAYLSAFVDVMPRGPKAAAKLYFRPCLNDRDAVQST